MKMYQVCDVSPPGETGLYRCYKELSFSSWFPHNRMFCCKVGGTQPVWIFNKR